MKIKIFTGSCISDLEKKVNRFIDDKYVVNIKQDVCCQECKTIQSEECKECKENKKCKERIQIITLTVMYYDNYYNKYCSTYL